MANDAVARDRPRQRTHARTTGEAPTADETAVNPIEDTGGTPASMQERREAPHGLLSARGLTVTFGGDTVLADIDLTVRRRRILTVIGPNGSGKSTLLRTLIGAVRPSAGAIRRGPGLRLGYVPQRLQLDPTLPITVARFLSLPRPVSRQAASQALADAGVAGLEARQLATLSGGQFQRVLLARALLNDPDVLLLDEAAQGLDHQGTAAFYDRIEQIRRERGCAVLMVSHELHVVMATSDDVICMNRRICCSGSPEQVASEPAYQALFGSAPAGALALYHHSAHSPDGSA